MQPRSISSARLTIVVSTSLGVVSGGLPGMSEKEIEVAVTDDTLTLKGEKRQEKEQKEKDFYLSERSHGSEGAGTAIEIDL